MKQKERRKSSRDVVDIGEFRSKKLEERRRNVERILFRNLLGVYSVIEGEALAGVQLIDISQAGMAFQTPWRPGQDRPFQVGDQITLRLYFGQETFLPCGVKIKNSQEVLEAGQTYLRYGAELDKEFKSFEAVSAFIDFIYKYAEHGKPEDGRMKLLFV